MGNWLSKLNPNEAVISRLCLEKRQLKGGNNINQYMTSTGFKTDYIYNILTSVYDRFPAQACDLKIEKGLRVKMPSGTHLKTMKKL